MILRTVALFLGVLVVSVGVSTAYYHFSWQEKRESEWYFLSHSIERRTQTIEEWIWRSIRQLDLFVGYYEASPDAGHRGMTEFLKSMWIEYPKLGTQAGYPIAMGWVDISRAAEDALVVYRDGGRRSTEITDDLHRLLDEVTIRSSGKDGMLMTHGRADRGEFGVDGGHYLSVLRPAYAESEKGYRVMKGVAYAVIDLKALFTETRSSEIKEPRLVATLDGGFDLDYEQSFAKVIVDEISNASEEDTQFSLVQPRWEWEILVGEHHFTLEYFHDTEWSYAHNEPVGNIERNTLWQSIEVGTAFAVILLLITWYFATQYRVQQRLTDKANAAAQARSDFLATMSHEIRTPMNGIFGMTELLGGTELSEQQRRYVDTVLFSAEVLLVIIDDILDFSKLEVGKMELDPVPTDLGVSLSDVTRLLATRASEKAIELHLNFEPGVPEHVVVDTGRLKQVVMNLLGNAIKFTERGHVVVGVSRALGAEMPAGMTRLRISVTDTGIGIPKENLGRIFERFEQSDNSTTRKFGGTGLGLAICQRIVDLMGGEMGVDSTVGKGSTFWFEITVPLVTAAAVQTPVGTELSGRRILVVDDTAFTNELITTILSAAGAEVQTCVSGAEALAAIRNTGDEEKPFDLALVDFQMPAMKGDALATQIRKEADTANLPIILVSALSGDSLESGEEGGLFNGIVTKPFTPHGLVNEIVNCLLPGGAGKMRGSSSSKSNPSSKPFLGRRVLVAEDSAVNQAYVRETLRQFGCEVTIAANGEDAVKFAQDSEYHIVLMDCHMPVMDGFKATQEIIALIEKGEIPYLPIVALTADAVGQNTHKCREVGMEDCISKPVRQEVLASKLEEWFAVRDRIVGPFVPPDEISPTQADEPAASPVVSSPSAELPVRMAMNGNSKPAQADPAPEADEDVASYVDAAVFQQGQELFEEQFWPLIDSYMKDLVENVRAIDDSLSENRLSDIHMPAHSIKSSSRQVGALRLGDIAAMLEACVMPEQPIDHDGLAPAIETLHGAVSKTCEALDAKRKTGTG